MAKYRKKPVVIEAFRLCYDAWPDWAMDALSANVIITAPSQAPAPADFPEPAAKWHPCSAQIPTLEGTMTGLPGDWIIRGVKGELYPCNDEIFKETYEVA
jgi:hypothetical protein